MTASPAVDIQPLPFEPIMLIDQLPDWSGAVWIGELDDSDPRSLLAGPVPLAHGTGFTRARMLVRSGAAPRGLIDLDVVDAAVDGAQLSAAVAALPPVAVRTIPERWPAISIVLCTYDRPALLERAITSALALDYPDYELVIIDNHPSSGLTPPVVAKFDDPRLRFGSAPDPGLARARNVGVLLASHEIIAFTDDDVVVDPRWLQGIATGFAADPDVVCVCGLVPTAELNSLAQAYFDTRVAWSRNCSPELFTLAAPRPDEPMFPFEVARFGTGANFGLRRTFALLIGGFDEGMGVGSPTGGGEDIDMFLRVLLAGRSLAYEPSAIIWHRHRTALDTLAAQVRDYGTGLGAFLTKLALQPHVLVMMIRRSRHGLRHARKITQVALPDLPLDFAALSGSERRGILTGPLVLARSRRERRRSRPLRDPGYADAILHRATAANGGKP